MWIKKRKTNISKKVFLATNISEILSGLIPIKYKDPNCPTLACTIEQTGISSVLLDLEQVLTCSPSQYTSNLGWASLVQPELPSNWLACQWKFPKEEITNVLIRVGEFVYPVNFIILETQPVSNLRSQTPVILGHPFLATANAIISCRNRSMRLTFGYMTKIYNVFNLGKQLQDVGNQTFEVNLIENLTSEHCEEIVLETKCEFDREFKDFNLD